MRTIHSNIDKFGPHVDATLSSLSKAKNLCINFFKYVRTIPISSTALHGFQQMRLAPRQVHALAIVDENGVIVGTLSSADLRGFTHEKLGNILLPVLEFLKAQGTHRAPVVCEPSISIKEVVALMINEKVHRVWLVDDDNKPVGVVSMTDIILYFYYATIGV